MWAFFTAFAIFISVTHCAILPGKKLLTLEPRILEPEINQSIECIKDILNTGIPEAGIPSLNPLIIDNLALDFDSDLLKGSVEVEDFELTGATGFVASHLKSNIGSAPGGGIGLGLEFTFDVEKVRLLTDYDTDITLLDLLPVYGKGQLIAKLKGLKVSGGLLITIGDEIGINDINITLSLDDSNVVLTGLLHNEAASAIVSQAITDLIPTLLDDYGTKVSEVIAKVMDYIISGGADLEAILKIFGPCLENILG